MYLQKGYRIKIPLSPLRKNKNENCSKRADFVQVNQIMISVTILDKKKVKKVRSFRIKGYNSLNALIEFRTNHRQRDNRHNTPQTEKQQAQQISTRHDKSQTDKQQTRQTLDMINIRHSQYFLYPWFVIYILFVVPIVFL